MLALTFCLFCFCSFAWAMIWHFRRGSGPSAGTAVVAVAAIASASIQIYGVATRPLHFASIALALYAASAGVFWWSVASTRASRPGACFQEATPAAFIASGPFRIIRHPFYAAYDLTWAAGFAATLWWPAAVSAIVMMGLYHRAALGEERAFSQSALAAQYREYARRTGRYFPRFAAGQ
jgi:protein-S-isoprenylcysteine O-methyltransferase Ste14